MFGKEINSLNVINMFLFNVILRENSMLCFNLIIIDAIISEARLILIPALLPLRFGGTAVSGYNKSGTIIFHNTLTALTSLTRASVNYLPV